MLVKNNQNGSQSFESQNTEDVAENDEFIESLETIENILKYHHGDSGLQIRTLDCAAGTQEGDNYMSVIKRILVKGKFHNSADFMTSLIIKRQIASKSRRELFRCDEAFANEIAAYCQLVPVLKKFCRDSIPVPMCLFAGTDALGDIVVLEDLNRQGFKMRNRLKGLDFEHCRVVMKELASFHAISMALKVINPQQLHAARADIREIVFCNDGQDFYSAVLDSSLNEALSSLKHVSNKNGELDVPIERLKKLTGKKLYKIMAQTVLCNKEKWSVLCHGDLWINNLLFANNARGEVDRVKFVDLQTVRYTNLVTDILLMFYSSTEKELRYNHFEELITIYQQSLVGNLRQYLSMSNVEEFYKLEHELTVDNIKKELATHALFGFGMCLWILPAVTFDRIPNLDTVTMNDFVSNDFIAQNHSNEYHIRIKDIVLEYFNRGFLDNLAV